MSPAVMKPAQKPRENNIKAAMSVFLSSFYALIGLYIAKIMQN
jgi:hypothetical protein